MFGYRNKFNHIAQVGYANIQSIIEINRLNYCSFKVLAIFIDADTRIKGVQTGDSKVKILNFPDDNTIFLIRDINCHTRLQPVLKPHEKASSSKTNFSKIPNLWAVAHRNKTGKPGQMTRSQLYIKIFRVHFVNSVLDNNNWGYNR